LTLYLDSSALFKRYVADAGSEEVAKMLSEDEVWVTANLTFTELSVNLPRRLDVPGLRSAIARLERDWEVIRIVRIDDVLCRRAAGLGPKHGLRTLDSLHLAAAERAGGSELTFLTFDHRLAGAARAMGFAVAGV
jgi:predicted nucleic acid-binding protein